MNLIPFLGRREPRPYRPTLFPPPPVPPTPPAKEPEPTVHELKTWPESFEAIRLRDKTAEFRKHDRDFKVGDKLVLREYVPTLREWVNQMGASAIADYPDLPKDMQGDFTGLCFQAEITHITTGYGIPEGYVMLSFRGEWYGLG